MKIYGIDVSHHQGVIDWNRTAEDVAGIEATIQAQYPAEPVAEGTEAPTA